MNLLQAQAQLSACRAVVALQAAPAEGFGMVMACAVMQAALPGAPVS